MTAGNKYILLEAGVGALSGRACRATAHRAESIYKHRVVLFRTHNGHFTISHTHNWVEARAGVIAVTLLQSRPRPQQTVTRGRDTRCRVRSSFDSGTALPGYYSCRLLLTEGRVFHVECRCAVFYKASIIQSHAADLICLCYRGNEGCSVLQLHRSSGHL